MPVELRKRRTTEDAAAPIVAPSPPILAAWTAGSMVGPNPIGFCKAAKFWSGPGARAMLADTTEARAAPSQATTRQPAPGRCPSGKSSSAWTPARVTVGTHIQEYSHAAHTANGSEPGWAISPKNAYPWQNTAAAERSPTLPKSQP